MFLDPLVDLVTCLDSNIPSTKKFTPEQSTAIRVVTTRLRQTFRQFFTGASEHMGTSNITGKRIKNAKDLAISDYLLQCDSPITFDDFDILAFDSNKLKLFIKESLLIKRDKLVLNRTTKSFWLDLFD